MEKDSRAPQFFYGVTSGALSSSITKLPEFSARLWTNSQSHQFVYGETP